MTYEEALRFVMGLDLEAIQWHQFELGFLQHKTAQQGDDAVDVHIWTQRLRTIPPHTLNGVHDHRVLIRSTVVVGAIREVRFNVAFEEPGDVDAWELRHPEVRMEGDDNLRFLGRVRVTELGERVVLAGETYEIPRHTWHLTRIYPSVAITVVQKTGGSGSLARTLGDIPPAAAKAMSRAMAPSAPKRKAEEMRLTPEARDVLREARKLLDSLV